MTDHPFFNLACGIDELMVHETFTVHSAQFGSVTRSHFSFKVTITNPDTGQRIVEQGAAR